MNRRINIYIQDSDLSITDTKGGYDYTRFSAHEASIVRAVLRDVKAGYPQKFRGLYLAANAEPIKYKARPILFECVAMICANAQTPYDCLALARAYTSKGYYYMEQALYWYEQYFTNSNRFVLSKLPLSYYPRFLYVSVAKLYEEIGDYEKALRYVDLMQRHRGLPILPDWESIKTANFTAAGEQTRLMDQETEEDWKNRLYAKMEHRSNNIPRKQMGAKRKNLEASIHEAAERFLSEL